MALIPGLMDAGKAAAAAIAAASSKHAPVLWDRFVVTARQSGAEALKQLAENLHKKTSYAKTGPLTKRFLATFSRNLGGRSPKIIWGAFAQQDWSVLNLTSVAQSLRAHKRYPDLAGPVQVNFSRAAMLLVGTKQKDSAAADEISFVRRTAKAAKEGRADPGAIAKAKDLARIHGLQADFQTLSKHGPSDSTLPIVLGIGGVLGVGALLALSRR